MRQLNSTRIGHQRRALAPIDSLQLVLWAIWTFVVAATAYASWQADMAAQHPLNLLGLVIHCSVAGVIALVALTLIEMRLRPTKFLDR